MKITTEKISVSSSAVQHAGKHFDMVLGIDIHWTKLPMPPFPLPLPHPFIGFIFDPVEYLSFTISVPPLLQKLGLPASIPVGASVYIHNRIKATTTSSVFGFGCSIKAPAKSGPAGAATAAASKAIPIKHITGAIPAYKIFLGDLEGPHDGEIYMGSESVIINGAKCGGSFPQQVLTCWGMPFGHQYFPPAWLALYQHVLTMYVQLNFNPPVLVGGTFVPHQYTLADILMRAAAVFLMKGLTFLAKKGLTGFNKALKKLFPNNPVSKALCFFGLEPVNFVTGAMNFEWDDFKLGGAQPIKWTSAWQSDVCYSGMMGNGVINNYDLFILPSGEGEVAAMNVAHENQVFPIPGIAVGASEEYYRPRKFWHHRPDGQTWIVRYTDRTYTYKAFPHAEFGTIYRVTRISHIDGTQTELHYRTDGRLLRTIEDNLGRKIDFTPDISGRRIAEIKYRYQEQEDVLVSYRYDERGNLTEVIDPLGKSICFTYDENNRVIHRKNRNNAQYKWKYDKQGRVIFTSGADGFQEGRITYGDGCNQIHYTRDAGKTEYYHYDENNLVYKHTDACGGETWYDYNAFQEQTLKATPEGKVTGYAYDERGNLITLNLPDNSVHGYVYDECNRLVEHTEPSGLKEKWEYDERGLLRQWTKPDGNTTRYLYREGESRPHTVCHADGSQTRLEYNRLGLICLQEDEKEVCQTMQYDAYGRTTLVAHGDGNVTRWRRDRMGRVTKYSAPGQKSLQIDYDAYDLPVEVRSGNAVWTMQYTPMGQLRKRTRRSRSLNILASQSYFYNEYDRLQSIENELGERYTFTYNPANALIAEKGFDGKERRYERDRDGNITVTHLPDGSRICHQYDLAGRLTYNRYSNGEWEQYAYDPMGRLVRAENPHSVTLLERDPLGNIVKEIQNGHETACTYDEHNRLTGISSDLGALISYRYSAAGELNRIDVQTAQGVAWQASMQTDRFGRETVREMTGNLTATRAYDSVGRPTCRHVQSNGLTTLLKDYVWNDNMRLSYTRNSLTDETVQYEYDPFGTLLSARRSYDGSDALYKNPDVAGNLYKTPDRTDRIYDRGGRLIADGRYHYLYDPCGNLCLKTETKPQTPQKRERNGIFGFITGEQSPYAENIPAWQPGDTAYTWYANGLLHSVTTPEGKAALFEYDALGRRISKTYNGKKTLYVWSGNVLLHEIHKEKDKEEEVTTWVYDNTGFNPAAKLVGNKSYSVINDYLGTPLQAYDEKGNLVWERELDIYGKTRKETKENYNFVPFLYQGQYLDSETDLCYNRFRYYDPNAGNYISQDPIGLAGGNPTLYGYVHDSNTQVDPLGLVPWDTGAFGDWFDSASIQDIINNKEAVSDALRGSGGMHEKFPVSMASKAKELGFTYSELMDMTVERSKVWFENVADRFGNIHSGPHSTGAKLPEGQSGKASSWFHKNLMEDLDGAKTKQEALDIINKHHNAHMKYK